MVFMTRVEVMTLDIVWEGPLTLAEVKGKLGPADYGLYQQYGSHNGAPNQLLYIGSAADQKFGVRVPHFEGRAPQPNSLRIYLGRLGGTEPIRQSQHPEWGNLIRQAEKILIFYIKPPFNAAGVAGLPALRETPPIAIRNYGDFASLPLLISPLYDIDAPWDYEGQWKPFT